MRVIDKCDKAFLQSCSRMEILQSGYGDDLEMHIAGMNSYVYCVERQQVYMYSVCRSATGADCIL